MKKYLALLFGVIAFSVIGYWLLSHLSDNGDTTLRESLRSWSLEDRATFDDPIDISLVSKTVSFMDGTEAVLEVPEDFEIKVVAEELGKARFMTMSPDGRLFVPDMVDYALSREGSVIVLDDWNEESKQFDTRHTYLSGLRGPNNVAFYTDKEGNDWLYLTLTEHLVRYPYAAGDTSPSGEPEVIYKFPNAVSETADSAVWHLTRTVLFVDDTMYVSVGSGCNLCEQDEDEERAMVLAMNPDGTDSRVYVDGLKNAVGLAWHDDALYVTENGTDHLGADTPDDTIFKLEEGAHYGWPYCYESNGEKYEENAIAFQREPVDCGNVPESFLGFPAHSAPIGVTYFENNSDETLHNSFLVALQGSWNPVLGRGYQVVRVSRSGEASVFIDGFMSEDGERVGQPVHVLQKNENSFFVTDDYNGRLYYVYKD